MNVFTCTDHDGRWVGVASVVVADSEAQARELLDAELRRAHLVPDAYTLVEIDTTKPQAIILQDGDY